mmetsp:Transcript_11728/g.50563  ORF Transcript_11728/g.50563 Transcript_11728/m.50563 type:complete len:443 (-) Transcript_11728:2179-3507(-)
MRSFCFLPTRGAESQTPRSRSLATSSARTASALASAAAARAAARAASASSLSLCASAAANPSSSPAADSMISSTVLGFGGGADCSARFFLRFPSGSYSRSESESSIDASSSSMKSPSGVSSGAKPALAALEACASLLALAADAALDQWCAQRLARSRTSGTECALKRSATTLATPDSLSARASTAFASNASSSLSILEESSLPLGLEVTCSSQVARVARHAPSSVRANDASCPRGILATADWQKAPRPDAVSRLGIISSIPSNVTASTGADAPSGQAETRRSTRFTSSLPSVISFCSLASCSIRSCFSFSRRLRMRSRAFSSSSGPSSPSTCRPFFPRRFFVFSFFVFIPRSASSSSSESSDPDASESSESSDPAMSARETNLNTSSKGTPEPPFMTCSACLAARHPVSMAPPTVSGCSLHVCSPAKSRRPPLDFSGRPSSS